MWSADPSVQQTHRARSEEKNTEIIVTDTKIPQAQESVTQKVNFIRSAAINSLTPANRNISEFLAEQD